MVTRYGVHERLPNLSLEQEPSPQLQVPGFAGTPNYSEHTAHAVDDAVKEIVRTAFERAPKLLGSHREILEPAAKLLLERETLTETDLAGFVEALAAGKGTLPKAA